MPQSTNLNTPPYFEDFDPDKNFHKVLFRPGYPLQARELTTLQSILQDQIEKFGSSIYKEGAMIIPGRIAKNLRTPCVLIEDEYFGISADLVAEYITGQIITGNTSGIRAKVVNVLTSEQSEKGYTTLYLNYLSGGFDNKQSTFIDDEILISESSFSIGSTVISENTDFAKCISVNSTLFGSSAKITDGVYFTKGYFVKVKEQEIILDQYDVTPSYKIGLEVLEEIVTPEDDTTLTDPSQGYSNYSAPGSHRFKLTAILTKKSLDDTSVTDFIELLRIEKGETKEIVLDSKQQLARNFESTFARRTYDESGDYVVKDFKYNKEECLNDGLNNGIFAVNSKTFDDNDPSRDLFELTISPGKGYVRGYEIDKPNTSFVDIEKPRDFASKNNATIRTDARGVEFRFTTDLSYSVVSNSLGKYVSLHNSSDTVIGYAIFRSYEEYSSYNTARLLNIKFISSGNNITNISKIRFGGTINYTNNTSSGGSLLTVTVVGSAIPHIFRAYQSAVKSLTDTKVQNVTTYVTATATSTNTISIPNRNYYSTTTSDYTLKISGDLAATISGISIDNSNTITITTTGTTVPTNTPVILIGPERIDNPTLKLASHQKMRMTKLSSITGKYDVNSSSLNFGVTRVSKIHAIYNPQTTIANPQDVLPKVTLTSATGTFAIDEIVIGRTTGAKGRIVKQVGNVLYFVYETAVNFIANEEIFGYKAGVVRNIASVDKNGYPNLKSRYILNDGQRDQVFDYSTLEKVSQESVISGDLYVIFDYFKDEVSSGQFYTVESYYDALYDDIPSYNLNGSTVYLTDYIDWRVNRESVYLSSTTGEYNSPFTLDASKLVTGIPLGLYGGTSTNTYLTSSQYLLPVGTTDADIEYYLARTDTVYLSYEGNFVVQQGNPSLSPLEPKTELNGAMKLVTLKMPAYLRDLNSIKIETYENRRYTMRDIGLLDKRITNMEYYTVLSLLETDTSNLFIDDGDGGNRLKNGFIVDNFLSHSIGNPSEANYSCSLDMNFGHLRAQHYTTNIQLNFEDVPQNNRKGRVLMLDYDDIPFINQTYAAVVENVNVFAVVTWNGVLELTPSTDDWFEENRIPDTVTEVEGNYTAIVESLGGDPNTGLIPTQWGSWMETQRRDWSTGLAGGFDADQLRLQTRYTVTEEFSRQIVNDRLVNTQFVPWIRSRNVNGNANSLKPNFRMYAFFGNRDINAYCTPKIIGIQMNTGSVAFQPGEDISINIPGRKFRATIAAANDKLESGANYEFILSSYNPTSTYLNLDLDSMAVLDNSQYGGYLINGDVIVGQQSGATATVTSTSLITDRQGSILFSFYIPSSTTDANPRWSSGDVTFRLTGDANNSLVTGITDTFAERTYSSTGTVFTRQFEVENVRNAVVTSDIVDADTRTVRTTTWVAPPPANRDPLAQSFFINNDTGIFMTKLDIYFQTKDSVLPITLEIRNIVNGYPGPTVFQRVVLNPNQVSVSNDASVPTTFTLDTPIYLAPGTEYSFVLITASTDYRVWLSEQGADDLNGERITKQPFLGVLFKSQNSSTWTTAELQDFKFVLYRAEFDTSQPVTLKFTNNNSGDLQFTKLRRDPLELNVNSGRLKVHHRNHGHHDNSSFVELKGVSSEQFTTLASDWGGTPGSPITVTGNRDTFANTDPINGNDPDSDNPAYLRIGSVVYTYDPNAVGTVQNDGTFTIVTIDKISGTTPSDGFKATDDWLIEYYVVDGVPLTLINTVHTQLEWITLDSYQINLSGITRNTVGNISFGGDNVLASQNVIYTQLNPSVDFVQYPGTNVSATFGGTSGTSLGSSSYSNPSSTTTPVQRSYVKDSGTLKIDLNNDNIFNAPKVIASAINEERQMIGAKSAELNVTLSSNVSTLSPYIVSDRISLITTSNRIANFDGTVDKEYFVNVDGLSTSPDETVYDIGASSREDYNPANYITKLISLANESTSLRIEFSAYNPSESDIDVYVKILSGDESDANSISWTEVTDSSYQTRRNELSFVDYSYNYSTTGSATFTQYAVKIRMRSNNQAVVPIIKDFRCIALA